MLSTIQYAGWSGEIPPDIASDIANDTSFLSSYPAAAFAFTIHCVRDRSYYRSGVSNWAVAGRVSDQRQRDRLPGLISDVPEPVLETLFPGFVVTSPIDPITLGQASYSPTAAHDASTNTVYEGTVNMDFIQNKKVEQPAGATPEPSSLALLSPGCAT